MTSSVEDKKSKEREKLFEALHLGDEIITNF